MEICANNVLLKCHILIIFKIKCISHAVSSCRAEVCLLRARVTLLWGDVGRVFRPVVNYRLYSPGDSELHTVQPTYPSVSRCLRGRAVGGERECCVAWAELWVLAEWVEERPQAWEHVYVCVILGTAAGVDAEISKLIQFLSYCSGPGGKQCDVHWQHTRQNHTHQNSISLPPCLSTNCVAAGNELKGDVCHF